MEAIHNYDNRTAKILIPFITNINEENTDDYNSTAIQYAIECYHCMVNIDTSALPLLLEIIELLLQKGGKPNTIYHQKEWQGETLLINTCQENTTDIIKLLLKHNASPRKRCPQGQSALQITIEERNVTNTILLLNTGAIRHIDPKRITSSTLNCLVRLASAYCSDVALKQLVRLNPNMNTIEEAPDSALFAISSLLDSSATDLDGIDTASRMQLLIQMGASPFTRTPNGTYANGVKDPFNKYDKATLHLILLCDDFHYKQSPRHLCNKKEQVKKLVDFYLQLLESVPSMHSLALTCADPIAFFKSQKYPILIAMYNHFPHFQSLQKTASKNSSSKEEHLKNFLSAPHTLKMTEQKFEKTKF